jgi:hypothetical protein
MKNLILLLVLLVSQNVFASSFSFECTFSGGEVIKGASRQYDFDDSFQSNFMPSSHLFAGATLDIYVIDGEEGDGQGESRELNFFVTDKLPMSAYSQQAQQLVGQMIPVGPGIKSVQIAFPTDLYSAFLLVSVEMQSGDIFKQAFAGLDMATCK